MSNFRLFAIWFAASAIVGSSFLMFALGSSLSPDEILRSLFVAVVTGAAAVAISGK